MIIKLISLVLFWRRNNIPSILFKSSVWAFLAWLTVGIFTSFSTAVIGGLAAFLLASTKYTLRYFKRRKLLLQKCDGDKEKLRQLETVTAKGGFGGALMNEMLNAELEMDDECNEPEEELSEEQIATNKAELQQRCAELTRVLVPSNYVSAAICQEATIAIIEDYSACSEPPEAVALLNEFLPQCVLQLDFEDYCNEDDHASLVDLFAESTLGKWEPSETTSYYDEESQKWVVKFVEDGKKKLWRFSQRGDQLNVNFLDQLISYTESKSGHIIHSTGCEDDFYEFTCLPSELHYLLFEEEEQMAA